MSFRWAIAVVALASAGATNVVAATKGICAKSGGRSTSPGPATRRASARSRRNSGKRRRRPRRRRSRRRRPPRGHQRASPRSIRRSRPCCRATTPICRRIRVVRDRGFRAERRSRSRAARLQPRRVGDHPLRQRRPAVLAGSCRRARARKHGLGRGSLRRRDRPIHGMSPKFGRFLSGHRLPERAAPARVGLRRRAAAYQAFLGGQYAQRRRAAEVGRADRHVPRARRRGRQRRRAFPARERNRTASATARSSRTPAATSARAKLARGALVPAHAADDRQYAERLAATTPVAFSGKSRSRSPTSSGNTRRTATRAKRNFKLQGEYFRRAAASPRSQSGWYLQGVYQFHAALARRRALRPARSGRRATAQRAISHASVQSAALRADARLHAVGVQPLPPAIRAEQDAARSSPTTSSSCSTS